MSSEESSAEKLAKFIYVVQLLEKFLNLLDAVGQFEPDDVKELRAIVTDQAERKDLPIQLKYIADVAPEMVDHIESLMGQLQEMAIQSELNQHRN